MKNRQKSRSGCHACKLRRLRCDEAKPSCRNCALKGLQCPGYQQRLQWSTKHEIRWKTTTNGPGNFTQLVTAASEVILEPTPTPSGGSGSDRGGPTGLVTSSPSPASHSDAGPSDVGTLVRFIKPREGCKTESQDMDVSDQGIPQPVVNIPSFLIDHWFKSVCRSWSVLDSHTNPYRTLTTQLWSTSETVFHALLAISAASLVERLPAVMRDTARAAPVAATRAIKKALVGFFNGKDGRFPSELLLALFCMSSSVAWLNPPGLGLAYLKQARAVLKTLNGWELNEEDSKLLEFFKGCLIYEEMLRSVVGQNQADLENMLSWPEPLKTAPAANSHAWNGVSPDMLRLFGKAVALCRKSRNRWRHNAGTSFRMLQEAVEDIEEATMVEEALLATDSSARTGPAQPPAHGHDLSNTTEAYRLSAILQLYESFPDLVTKRVPSLMDDTGATVWTACVTPLALRIARILQQLPVSSMRRIQPLLCLCAASGLRFENKGLVTAGQQDRLLNAGQDQSSRPAVATTGSIPARPMPPSLGPLTATSDSFKVSQARRFLIGRLEQLGQDLPPKPIGVAKQLVQAVWRAYDGEIGTARRTHWLDVMSTTGLHSTFG